MLCVGAFFMLKNRGGKEFVPTQSLGTRIKTCHFERSEKSNMF